MRIPTASSYERALRGLQDQSSRLSEIQQQLTSQTRISKPSDDPQSAAQAERLRSASAKLEADQRMIGQAKVMLQQADGAIGSATELLQTMRETLLTAANTGTLKAEDLAALGGSLRGTLGNLLTVANQANGNGGYIFGGAGGQTAPFVDSGAVAYQAQSGQQTVAAGLNLALSQDGAQAFMNISNGSGGSQSIFAAISATVAVLEDPAATAADVGQAVRAGITGVDESISRLSLMRTHVGESLKMVDVQSSLAETSSINLQSRLSELVDLDYAKALAEFTTANTAHQAAMQTYASISKMSMFQYL